MAATEENHEVTDEVQANSDRNDESLKGTETEPPNNETLSSEQAETQPAGEDAPTSEKAEPNVLNELADTQPEVADDAPTSDHSEPQEMNDVAETQEFNDVAEPQELNDVADTQEFNDVAEAQELNDVAETQELNDVADAQLMVEEDLPTEEHAEHEEPPKTELAEAELEKTETKGLNEEKEFVPELAETHQLSNEAEIEPNSTELADPEPSNVNSELVDHQPPSIEMVNSYHDGSEQPVMYEQPVNETTQPDADNATLGTQNEEEANVDTMVMEHENQPQYNEEQVTVEGEPMNVDISDQQVSYSEPMTSELGHMQHDGSELVVSHHVEYVDTQSYDHENHHHHSGMYHMEPIHEKGEFVKMEHSHPESLHEDVVNADLEDQLHMDSDLMHELQVTSELAHQLQVPSDLVHMQSDIVHSQPMNSELVHSEFDTSPNMQIVAAELVNSDFPDPEVQPSKRRKKKSVVWEHFTIEAVGAGCRRACCKVCKQSFAYSTGSKVAGTSHLKRHIAKGSCPLLLRQQDKSITPFTPKSEVGTPASTDPPKRRYRTSNAPYLIFDQDRCRHEIARMIIMHEYPLQMVEHSGFVSFVQNLQPRFDMVNFSTVQGDCVATYLREKQNLQKIIDTMPGRICLSVDMWTSCQTTGYVFLHCQFIDQEFKLQRRLLNVVMEPFPESDNAFSHAVGTCLSYWNLDNKLCSITFSQPLSDGGRENMRGLLSVKNQSTLNGQLLLGNCLSRTLSGMAQDVLAAGQDVVRKIRSVVKYVKTSDANEDKFLEFKQQLQVPSDKTLTLDNITKWNTTYDMLVAACELKEVFPCLDTSEHEYKDSPTMDEWIQAENVCMYLRILYETANFLIEKIPPSTNVFFHEVWKIQLELTRNASSEDPFVRSVASTLQDKFLSYWRGSFLVLAIAVAMDPRFKMKLVEFSFAKLFGEEAPAYIRMADEGIHGLFHEYMALSGEVGLDTGGLVSSNGLTDFDMYIMETTSQQMKSELDEYLDESLLPRMQDLDVIGWWKLNRIKYPTLSKMARDILSIPLSSVGPGYVFDTVSRDMDPQWSSLRPETMEALMCAKDWLSV